MLLRILLALTTVFALIGCSGSNAITPSPFQGTYRGTWTNVENAADSGTTVWTISADGVVSGQDIDAGRETIFDVVGTIDANGTVTTTSTPRDGSGSATLNGTLRFEGANTLAGNLVWGILPPLTYLYAFTRD